MRDAVTLTATLSAPGVAVSGRDAVRAPAQQRNGDAVSPADSMCRLGTVGRDYGTVGCQNLGHIGVSCMGGQLTLLPMLPMLPRMPCHACDNSTMMLCDHGLTRAYLM